MNRYLATALALKAFSLNGLTKKLYRYIGNTRGSKRRFVLDPAYLKQAAWLRDKVSTLQPGRKLRALELGTGWMHFYALYLLIYVDLELTLFDVWDNRQLSSLKSVFSQLREQLTAADRQQADEVLTAILEADDYQSIYDRLGIEYVIDHDGSLSMLDSESFDLIFSMDVLEHITAGNLAHSIREYYRLLKDDGYSIHQVGVDDHLTHYAPRASKKQYLSIAETTWRRYYQNDVQYINRVSYDQFRELFESAGFSEIEATARREPGVLEGIDIAEEFRNQSRESLEATRVFLIHRK